MRLHYLSIVIFSLIHSFTQVVWSQTLPASTIPAPANDPPRVILPPMAPVTVESSRLQREGAPAASEAPISARPMSAQAAPAKVFVSGFRFSGNTAITHSQLQALVAGAKNKSYQLAELQEVTEQITKLYRSRGYLVARAYLPPQQSTDGTVEISILEGHLSSVILKNTSALSDERLQKTLSQSICNSDTSTCNDALLQEKQIERAVLLVRDLPGVTASIQLRPGQATGSSEVVADVTTSKPSVTSMGLDNYGTGALGTVRYSLSTDRNNFSGIGDQLTLSASGTAKGAFSGGLAYNRPVYYSGARIGAGYARSQYQLGKGYETIKAYGTGDAVSAYFSYPAVRTINQSIYLRLLAEGRVMNDKIEAQGYSAIENRQRAGLIRTSINGDNLDGFAGGGYMVYGLTFSAGRVTANATDDVAKVLGQFSKLGFNLSRQQNLGGAWTLYSALIGQTAGKNLHGSEQMGLGGPNGVRAYPSGEAPGSSGAIANLELRYTHAMPIKPATNLTYAMFVDRGWIDPYKYYWLANQPRDNRALTGYGLGITAQSAGFFMRAIYAKHKENETSQVDAGRNYQFWLQAGNYF